MYLCLRERPFAREELTVRVAASQRVISLSSRSANFLSNLSPSARPTTFLRTSYGGSGHLQRKYANVPFRQVYIGGTQHSSRLPPGARGADRNVGPVFSERLKKFKSNANEGEELNISARGRKARTPPRNAKPSSDPFPPPSPSPPRPSPLRPRGVECGEGKGEVKGGPRAELRGGARR